MSKPATSVHCTHHTLSALVWLFLSMSCGGVHAERVAGAAVSLTTGTTGVAAYVATAPANVNGVQAPSSAVVQAPATPTKTGNNWAYYRGTLNIASEPFYSPHEVDFEWAYSTRKPLPKKPRILVSMHGSGGGLGSVRSPFAPGGRSDIEIRNQDAEAHRTAWREWWAYSSDGQPYPGRRIAATLSYIAERHPDADIEDGGIVLTGNSMGGTGAIVQTMILPAPWRARIAYATGSIGVLLPRRVNQRDQGQFGRWPRDDTRTSVWDAIDFALLARSDPIVRGMHYRHLFSTNDPFSAGPDGNTQLEFVNLVESNRIGGAFFWVRNGHNGAEPGINRPWLTGFEVPEQDVTLDRAHPAITASTGNYPLSAAEREDEVRFPRGHYNMGITWDHARIVDSESELAFPLKYVRRTGIGGGIPDQPEQITISVTPRRSRHFAFVDGQVLNWSWDGGALSGSVNVHGDTVTIDGIPLRSGEPYKVLRIRK